jgi:hypothetical protein
VDPCANNNEALIVAIRTNSEDTFRLLLRDKRVDPTIQNNRAIQEAAANGTESMVLTLLERPGGTVTTY